MKLSADIKGLDVIVKGLEDAPKQARLGALRGVLDALDFAFKASYDMLSEGDHTLRELAEMGHPYSAEHGFEIHSPDELIHVQSGEYRDALKISRPEGSFGDIIAGSIFIDGRMEQLDRWLQLGTTKMRARPWMEYIVQHFGEDFAAIIEARIRAAIAQLRISS